MKSTLERIFEKHKVTPSAELLLDIEEYIADKLSYALEEDYPERTMEEL